MIADVAFATLVGNSAAPLVFSEDGLRIDTVFLCKPQALELDLGDIHRPGVYPKASEIKITLWDVFLRHSGAGSE